MTIVLVLHWHWQARPARRGGRLPCHGLLPTTLYPHLLANECLLRCSCSVVANKSCRRCGFASRRRVALNRTGTLWWALGERRRGTRISREVRKKLVMKLFSFSKFPCVRRSHLMTFGTLRSRRLVYAPSQHRRCHSLLKPAAMRRLCRFP
jgi:hypothetical protein